jgi:N utilization substance protein A
MGVKLGTEEIRYIGLFESMTGATVVDCILENEKGRVVYVVKEGEVGLAVGRSGANIQRVRDLIGKSVEVIEYSEDPTSFVKNILRPAQIRSAHISQKRDDKNVVMLDVPKKDRGIAIGKNGRNIERAKYLMKRHHDIDDIMII